MSNNKKKNKLVEEFVNSKDLSDLQQALISKAILSKGSGSNFATLPNDSAEKVYDKLKSDGLTYWINKATGQTDITDGDQQAEEDKVHTAEGGASMHQLSQVLDEESGQIIEVSSDMRRIAHNVQQRIEGATIITAFLIQLVRDEKLYLALGCGSFKEYADTMLPFNRRTAYKYISIGEKFAPLLPSKITGKSVQSTAQMAENLISDDSINELTSIGTEKLYELTRIPDADFEEVINNGVVKMPDGEEWSLEDIKAESSRKITERVKEVKADYQKRVSNLEEDKKKARSERDHYRDQLEKNQDRIERAQRIEQKYGAEASRMEEVEYLLDDTEAGIKKIEKHFGKIDIGASDPDEYKERTMSLMRRMTMQLEAARNRFNWLDDMDAFSAFPSWKLDDSEVS